MKLSAGSMFWPKRDGPVPSYPPLADDLQCEIAVIGAGTIGAAVAYVLSKAGINVALLEGRDIGHGSTAANTGLLLYELDVPLVELSRMIGPERAGRAYRIGVEAIDEFDDLTRHQLDYPCGFQRRGSLYLASSDRDVPALREEHDARRKLGIDVRLCNRANLQEQFGITAPAALWSTQAAEVDPFLLTHALVSAAFRNGAAVFARTRIDRWTPDAAGVTLHSTAGHRVRAKRVVFATGYELIKALRSLPVRRRVTYAAVSRPLNREFIGPKRPMIWETARPYFYMRDTADGRAILGGEDEPLGASAFGASTIQEKSVALCRRFNALYPNVRLDIDSTSCGAFFETPDGLPYFGEHAAVPNAYFALGFGGNGTTFSLAAGHVIRDLYTGRGSADAPLFALNRR